MRHRIAGFTLVEMLVTLAVLAILLTIALPNYRDYVVSSRMTAQANDLLTALHMARSEAVKRNAPITVQAKGGDWANGWQVRDADNNVLRDFPALKGDSTLDSGGLTTVTFQATGQATAMTFELRSTGSSDPGRDISIDIAGRPSVSKP